MASDATTDLAFEAPSLRTRSPRAPRAWIAWGASFALHAALTGGVALLLRARSGHAPEPVAVVAPASTIAVELPSMSESRDRPTEGVEASDVTPDARDPIGKLPPTFGGSAIARTDTGHAGRGGQMQVAAPAINLEVRDEHVHLSPDPIDRLDRDQVQRLKTAEERTAWEDRRATLHPTELSFLASGQGERPERRAPAKADPSRGLAQADAASRPGGVVGGNATQREQATEDETSRQMRGAVARGDVTSAAGLGVTNGQLGFDHRVSADVAHARPDVATGPTTIPARAVARPNDTVDSDQEVATALQSLVHASTAGGAVGAGEGGSEGAKGSAPGAGGDRGDGSRARPLGDGAGDWFDIDTSDPRLLPYFRKLHARIDPLTAHAFPDDAALDLKQGTVILDFVIHADGSATVEWPPRRASGIPAFDKNCADAIRKAAPFDPPPVAILGANQRELRVRAPFAETRRW